MFKDLLDGFLFIIIRFGEHVFVEAQKFFFQLCVLFQDGVVVSFGFYDHVVHSVLESGTMKEGGIFSPYLSESTLDFCCQKISSCSQR